MYFFNIHHWIKSIDKKGDYVEKQIFVMWNDIFLCSLGHWLIDVAMLISFICFRLKSIEEKQNFPVFNLVDIL